MLQLEALFGTVGARADEQVLAGRGADKNFELAGYEILADVEHEITESVKMQNTSFQLDQLFSMYNHVKKFGVDRTFLSLYNNDGRLNAAIGVRFPSCEDMNAVGSPNSNASQVFIAAMEDENGGFFSKVIAFVKKVWGAIVKFFKTVWTKIKSWFGGINKQDEKANAEIQRANISQDAKAEVSTPEPGAIKRAFTSLTGWIKDRRADNAESDKLCKNIANMVKAGKDDDEIERYIESADEKFKADMQKAANKAAASEDKAREKAEKAANKAAEKSDKIKGKWLELFGIDDSEVVEAIVGNDLKNAAKDITLTGKSMDQINREIEFMLDELSSSDAGNILEIMEQVSPNEANRYRQAADRLRAKATATDIDTIRNNNDNARELIRDGSMWGSQYSINKRNAAKPGLWSRITGVFNSRTKLAAYHQKEAQEIIRDLSAYRVHLHKELKKIYNEVIGRDRDLKLDARHGKLENRGISDYITGNDTEIEREHRDRAAHITG